MEKRAQKILNKLESLLEWHIHEKDTPLYQEIRVLLRYHELELMDQEEKWSHF